MSTPRPGGGSLRPAIVAAAVLLGQQVASRATRDAFFLSVFDVAALPTMTAAAAAVSLAATILASRALARLSPARLLPLALAFSVAAFVGEFLLALWLVVRRPRITSGSPGLGGDPIAVAR